MSHHLGQRIIRRAFDAQTSFAPNTSRLYFSQSIEDKLRRTSAVHFLPTMPALVNRDNEVSMSILEPWHGFGPPVREEQKTDRDRKVASVITLKPATCGHFKTGHFG
jgi:hypothetical protein